MIPGLIRSFSTKQGDRQEPDSPNSESGCTMCGLWKPRPSSYEVGKSNEHEPPEENNVRTLNDIQEDAIEDPADPNDIQRDDDAIRDEAEMI